MFFMILERLKTELTKENIKNIYFRYDKIPTMDDLVIVLDINECTQFKPVHSSCTTYIPFRGNVEFIIWAPRAYDLSELYNYWNEKIFPVLNNKISGIVVTPIQCKITWDNVRKCYELTSSVEVCGVSKQTQDMVSIE